MSYIQAHWRGNAPLSQALWFNFIGLSFLVAGLELSLLKQFAAISEHFIGLTIASLVVTRLIIFPWQFVGLMRATEKDFIAHRSVYRTRIIQAFALLSVVFTMAYAVEVLQSAVFARHQAVSYAKPGPVPGYQLALENQGMHLRISGEMDVGITREVRKLIETNPGIITVVLESPGGQIYEGRGLSILFTEHGLDTYSYGECSSSCATAFIGGRNRTLGRDGRLGFHQYQVKSNTLQQFWSFYDTQAEQKRDLALFEARNISAGFLEKIFRQPGEEIWFPSHSELLSAGVVHKVMNEPD